MKYATVAVRLDTNLAHASRNDSAWNCSQGRGGTLVWKGGWGMPRPQRKSHQGFQRIYNAVFVTARSNRLGYTCTGAGHPTLYQVYSRHPTIGCSVKDSTPGVTEAKDCASFAKTKRLRPLLLLFFFSERARFRKCNARQPRKRSPENVPSRCSQRRTSNCCALGVRKNAASQHMLGSSLLDYSSRSGKSGRKTDDRLGGKFPEEGCSMLALCFSTWPVLVQDLGMTNRNLALRNTVPPAKREL